MSIMFNTRTPTAGTTGIRTPPYMKRFTQILTRRVLKLISASYKFCWKHVLKDNLNGEHLNNNQVFKIDG